MPTTRHDRAVARVPRDVIRWFTSAVTWFQQTRPGRANTRFGTAGGGLLTGGIAYAALFSLMAALTLGVTVFTAVLGRHQDLRSRVLDDVSAALPGLIDTGDGEGAIRPDSLTLTTGFSVTGVIAIVVLLLSAITWMSALRTAVRAMFGESAPHSSAIAGKLREVAGFAGLSLAVLVSAVLGITLTSAVHWALGLLGLGGGSAWVVAVVGALVAFVVDGLTFVLLVVVVAGVRPPRRDLVGGALISAVGLGVVRQLGLTVVVGAVGKNALLASFAVLVTLLIWINLVSRVVLLAAAWTANPPLPSPPHPPSTGATRRRRAGVSR